MTKKFNGPLENIDTAVMPSPTSKQQHAGNKTAQDGRQQYLLDATTPTPQDSQRQEGHKSAVLERWLPIVGNVTLLAFLGASLLLSIQYDYLFFEELLKVCFIITMLLIFKQAGDKGHTISSAKDDPKQAN